MQKGNHSIVKDIKIKRYKDSNNITKKINRLQTREIKYIENRINKKRHT